MYPFIRRHDACSKLQLSRVRGNLADLVLFLTPTEEGAGSLGAGCLDIVQPLLRARNRSIQLLAPVPLRSPERQAEPELPKLPQYTAVGSGSATCARRAGSILV